MDRTNVIWLFILLLIILALVGGLAVDSWFFLVLVLCIILAVFT